MPDIHQKLPPRKPSAKGHQRELQPTDLDARLTALRRRTEGAKPTREQPMFGGVEKRGYRNEHRRSLMNILALATYTSHKFPHKPFSGRQSSPGVMQPTPVLLSIFM